MDEELFQHVKRTIELLEELCSINSEHWSDSDLKKLRSYLYHREPLVALEFFVNRWTLKTQVLSSDSCDLIVETVQRMERDPDVYIQRLAAKDLWHIKQ